MARPIENFEIKSDCLFKPYESIILNLHQGYTEYLQKGNENTVLFNTILNQEVAEVANVTFNGALEITSTIPKNIAVFLSSMFFVIEARHLAKVDAAIKSLMDNVEQEDVYKSALVYLLDLIGKIDFKVTPSAEKQLVYDYIDTMISTDSVDYEVALRLFTSKYDERDQWLDKYKDRFRMNDTTNYHDEILVADSLLRRVVIYKSKSTQADIIINASWDDETFRAKLEALFLYNGQLIDWKQYFPENNP